MSIISTESYIKTEDMATHRVKTHWYGDIEKRAIDIFISGLGLVLLAPLFAYVAFRIKRESPGPVFYRGLRSGRNGKVFRILKFRTMVESEESYNGPPVTARDDPRITNLGRFLRATKLNEFPQLINVLRGEMSLVGPRPEDPEIVKTWPEDTRREILSMRPGITSPASVLYRDEESLLRHGKVMETYLEDILPSKLRLDQLYVRNHSIWSDLDVVFWTFLVFLPQMNSYKPPEQYLFLGPLTRLMGRYLNWFIVDNIIVFLAMVITGLIWRSFGPLDVGRTRAIGLALGFALLFSLVNVILRVNRIEWSRAPATDVLDLLPGVAVATTIALVANHLVHFTEITGATTNQGIYWSARPLLPSGMIITASLLSFVGFVALRYRSRLVTGLATRWLALRGASASTQERVLIIGGGETGRFAAWMFNTSHYAESFRVVGYVDDDLFKQGSRIHGLNVLGQRTDVPRLVEKYDIGIIVFAIHNISNQERRELLNICSATSARLFIFPDILGSLQGISSNDKFRSFQFHEDDLGKDRESGDFLAFPWYLSLIKLSPLMIDEWFSRLNDLAEKGDVNAIRQELQLMRQQAKQETKLA